MNSQNEIAMEKEPTLHNFESVGYAKLISTNHAHIRFYFNCFGHILPLSQAL